MLIDGYVAEQMKKAMLNSEQEQVKIYDAYYNKGVVDGRTEAIKEVALKIQKIKDNHNENPRLYPINYGTLCGICNDLWKQLKE